MANRRASYVRTFAFPLIWGIACIAFALACVAAAPAHAFAQTLDLGVSLGSGYTVEVDGVTVDNAGVKDPALQRVREWRQDALDDASVRWDGMTMRDYLGAHGIPEADYLDPTWSNEAERICIQRAFECCISWDHTRPNGDSCFTATYPVGRSGGEVISGMWGRSAAGTISAHIDLWASEKRDYVNGTGRETGHYTFLIDPSATHFGFAVLEGRGVGRSYSGSKDSSETGVRGEFAMRFNVPLELIDECAVTCSVASVRVGQEKELPVYIDYEGLPLRLVGTWSSDDPEIAAITPGGMLKGVSTGTASLHFTATDPDGEEVKMGYAVRSGVDAMYRLYNPNSGEHFYTADEAERDDVVNAGWNYEGIGWYAPAKNSKPVYRLYNPYAGDHHYTLDAAERENLKTAGWLYEGVGWYSGEGESVPLYRQYNPYAEAGTHNYTADKGENDSLVSLGWKGEGIGWYGV